jgi:hypothetical protein
MLRDIFENHGKELLFAIGTISLVNWSWPLYSAATNRLVKKRLLPLLREFLLYIEEQSIIHVGTCNTSTITTRNGDVPPAFGQAPDAHAAPGAFLIIRRLFHIMGAFTGGIIGYMVGKLCHEAGVVTRWAPNVGAFIGALSGLGTIFVALPLISVLLARLISNTIAYDQSNDNVIYIGSSDVVLPFFSFLFPFSTRNL